MAVGLTRGYLPTVGELTFWATLSGSVRGHESPFAAEPLAGAGSLPGARSEASVPLPGRG